MNKKELIELGDEIPFGRQRELTDLTGFSGGYISRFFKGDYPLTPENAKIVKEAKKIIAEEKRKIKKALK